VLEWTQSAAEGVAVPVMPVVAGVSLAGTASVELVAPMEEARAMVDMMLADVVVAAPRSSLKGADAAVQPRQVLRDAADQVGTAKPRAMPTEAGTAARVAPLAFVVGAAVIEVSTAG